MIRTTLDLRARIYHQLGDDPVEQRLYQWSAILPYLNDGAAYMRAACGDIWGWDIVQGVALSAEYDFPEKAHRLIRVAYDDETLSERSRAYLDAIDWNWKTRAGTPQDYTVDGLQHDRFRLYPVPQSSSSDQVEAQVDPNLSAPLFAGWRASWGKATRILDGAGAPWTFIVDPNLAPPIISDPDFGRPVHNAQAPAFGAGGHSTGFSGTNQNTIEVWFVEKCDPMANDGDPVPIFAPFRLGPALYALWKIYEEVGDHHNSILSAFFRDWFLEMTERCSRRAKSPTPAMIHVRRPAGLPGGERFARRYSDRMTDPGGNVRELVW